MTGVRVLFAVAGLFCLAFWVLPLLGLADTPLALARPGLLLGALLLGLAEPPLPGRRGIFALAVLSGGLAWAYNTCAAACSDPYGYVSQAELWLHGDLHVKIPWLAHVPWPDRAVSVSSLGYAPAVHDPLSVVPTYSIGLPMLMAAAKAVGGQRALYAVVPLSMVLLVLGVWRLGRKLTCERQAAVAAILVAACPTVFYMSMWPMTDVPVTAAWTWAFLLVFEANRRSALAAGACAGLAILIRPNLVFGAAVLGLYLLADWWKGGRTRERLWRGVLFVPPVVAAAALVAAVNHDLYGSATSSGYGNMHDLFGMSHVPKNLEQYGLWLLQTQSPLVVMLLAPALWKSFRDPLQRGACLLFIFLVAVHYCLYLPFDAWWYLRFLLPAFPFALLALAFLFVRWCIWSRRLGSIVLALYCAWGMYAGHTAFQSKLWQRLYILANLDAARWLPENSLTMTSLHSGTLRYYTGRNTMRFDNLDPAWLDRAVEFCESHGVPVFLLLQDWEAAQFRQRFARQKLVTVVDSPALYEMPLPNGDHTRLWSFRPGATTTRRELKSWSELPGILPPAPPLPLHFTGLNSRRSPHPSAGGPVVSEEKLSREVEAVYAGAVE